MKYGSILPHRSFRAIFVYLYYTTRTLSPTLVLQPFPRLRVPIPVHMRPQPLLILKNSRILKPPYFPFRLPSTEDTLHHHLATKTHTLSSIS